MSHLLLVVVLIAIVDSVNPATVAPALYLAAGKTAFRSLVGFIAGVFVINLVGGILIDRSSFLVGAGIMAVELPTALPYFAAIAAIIGSDEHLSTQIGLLVVFNAIFVAPLPMILAVRLLAGARGEQWLEGVRTYLDERLALLIPAVVVLVGVALIVLGTIG